MENTNKNKINIKKILQIIGDVILIIIFIFVIFLLFLSITSKKNGDDASTIFSYQFRYVTSSSMEECDLTDVSEYKIKSIAVKSCIIIETAPKDEEELDTFYSNIQVGDVLTIKYVYVKQETITHRVKSITKTEDGYIITLEGDNKNYDSNLLTQVIDTSKNDSPNYIIGKVVGVNVVLGYLVYAIKTPVGTLCFIIIPALLIALYEIIRIILALSSDKKEKQKKKEEEQEEEINKLKKKLEELENKKE